MPTDNKRVESEMKKAGEFEGDLRNLPRNKPVKRQQPKREDPKFEPITLPTPGVKKPQK